MTKRWSCVARAVLFCGLLAGCGGEKGPDRMPISGAVTLDAQPLLDGDILFVPADGKGPSDGGKITAGKYSLTTTVGQKKVEIRATRENPAKMVESGTEPGKKVPLKEDYIPAEYNASTTLTADVTAKGKNEFPFTLVGKPAGQ